MANKIKNKILKRKINQEFRRRLLKYSRVIELIMKDYSDERLLPKLPDLSKNPGENIDLFSWSRHEVGSKHLTKIERRTSILNQLHGELSSILETVPSDEIIEGLSELSGEDIT